MKSPADSDDMLLREIRSAMSPTAAEEGRLRARLGAALGIAALPAPASLDTPLGAGPSGAGVQGSTAPSLDAPLGAGPSGAEVLGSTAASPGLWGIGWRSGIQGLGKQLIAAGIVAASGFGLGYVAGGAESVDPAAQRAVGSASARSREVPAAPDTPSRARVREAPAAAVEPGLDAMVEPPGQGAEEALVGEGTARHGGTPGARRSAAALHEAPGAQDAGAAAGETADPRGRRASLDEEALQLRRVGRSLRDGHPLLALKILDDLEIRVPNGALREERVAARLMARCLVGDRDAPATAAAWLRDHPKSVYAPRLRASCPQRVETDQEELVRP